MTGRGARSKKGTSLCLAFWCLTPHLLCGCMSRSDVAVLGAGLLGCCTALELAARGHRVSLFDREAFPLAQTSRIGEGKVHLGFLYAKDPSLRTAETMRRGALSFVPFIEQWLGGPLPADMFSTPFHYAVHRDSMVTSEVVADHFRAVEAGFAASEKSGRGYPGWDGGPMFSPLTKSQREAVYGDYITAVFRTVEVAIDPFRLADLLSEAVLASDRIAFHSLSDVLEVAGDDGRFEVVTTTERHGPFQDVVNALWSGRLEVDARRGIVPDRSWMFRFKVGIRLDASDLSVPVMPSTTVVLGPFGDLVDRGGGRWYMSWYPVCRLSASGTIEFRPIHGLSEMEACVEPTFAALEDIVPGSARLRGARVSVAGGTIFSWGESDVDHPASELHQRFDIGPMSFGRYHTVDTGKLTTAPLFAMAVADRVAL